jgi:hypothetical protein
MLITGSDQRAHQRADSSDSSSTDNYPARSTIFGTGSIVQMVEQRPGSRQRRASDPTDERSLAPTASSSQVERNSIRTCQPDNACRVDLTLDETPTAY